MKRLLIFVALVFGTATVNADHLQMLTEPHNFTPEACNTQAMWVYQIAYAKETGSLQKGAFSIWRKNAKESHTYSRAREDYMQFLYDYSVEGIDASKPASALASAWHGMCLRGRTPADPMLPMKAADNI